MQEAEDKADEKTNKDKDSDDSDNEGHPLDLFRAIFKNSDSESSSSSDKSDDDKSDDDDEDTDEKPKMGDQDEDRSSPTVIMPPESQLLQGKKGEGGMCWVWLCRCPFCQAENVISFIMRNGRH